MDIVKDKIAGYATPADVAATFLDFWYEEHKRKKPRYTHLGKKFASCVAGKVSNTTREAIWQELHKGRVARGWPDPTPGTIMPSIEWCIMNLWMQGTEKLAAMKTQGNA
jgi:hypothetical protein